MTYDRIIFQKLQPSRTDVAWAKPVPGGFGLYLYFDGKWQPQRLMNDEGTINPDDDEPIDIHEGQLGPNTVGTEQIIDGAVEMEDLHDDVVEKIQKTYYENEEELHMGFDVAGTYASSQPIIVEKEEEP